MTPRRRLARPLLALLAPLALLAAGAAPARGAEARVTFAALLAEMTDRAAVARWPDPAYRTLQASSWDRAAARDGRPNPSQGDAGWFANADYGHYARVEQRDGRTEKVLLDAEGPGAVVRLWSANPDVGGTLRVYLDGADEPVIEEDFKRLTDGTGPVAPPLSAVRARGHNLYLPIPFARRCTITIDGDKDNRLYYVVNYRRYADGTAVESLRRGDLAASRGAIAAAQKLLSAPADAPPLPSADGSQGQSGAGATITRDTRMSINLGGQGAVRELTVTLRDVPDAAAMERALRSLVLVVEADDQGTLVEAPVGDFFGSGVGLNPHEDWYRTVTAAGGGHALGGTLTSRFVMPFRASMRIALENRGEAPVEAHVSAATVGWRWDEGSMYFRANYRQERGIPARPRRDFNYLTAEGRGVYVGDTLAVANPTPAWWGEGDEKVYVDGEAFPSHFGTGTEDYYGYAWCCPDVFAAPFHGQPRADGPDNFGHVTNTRVRSLDAIPFGQGLRFDMEVWHWQAVDVSYAVTTYWYARPGATAGGPAARGAMDLAVPELPNITRLAGVVEGEALAVAGTGGGEFAVGRQMLFGAFEGDWSDGAHLWVRATAAGQFVDLKLPTPDPAPQALTAWLTRAPDYGVVQFSVNGRPVGGPVDLYAAKVGPTGPVKLGAFTPAGAETILRVEIVGKNDKSTGHFAGLDAVRVEPAE